MSRLRHLHLLSALEHARISNSKVEDDSIDQGVQSKSTTVGHATVVPCHSKADYDVLYTFIMLWEFWLLRLGRGRCHLEKKVTATHL